uniref:Uncharacterized protein n=1 Tax=Arundo donax TaxID=35708 RepID=A0A0A9D985_ARUDO
MMILKRVQKVYNTKGHQLIMQILCLSQITKQTATEIRMCYTLIKPGMPLLRRVSVHSNQVVLLVMFLTA